MTRKNPNKEMLPAIQPEISESRDGGRKETDKDLYIDEDEDHVVLEYLEEKGYIKGSAPNTFIPKLIYIYIYMRVFGRRKTGMSWWV